MNILYPSVPQNKNNIISNQNQEEPKQLTNVILVQSAFDHSGAKTNISTHSGWSS